MTSKTRVFVEAHMFDHGFEGSATFVAGLYRALLAIEVPRVLRAARPDFAHFQYFTPIVKSCDWIVTIHDVLFNDFPEYFPPNYRRLRNVLFPISARRANILTTVSPYSSGRISRWYRIGPDRIEITPNGVEPPVVDEHKRAQARAEGQPNGRYLVCVSRFEPRKNQVAVLNAFLAMELWRRGLSLVFVGTRTLTSSAFDNALANAPDAARRTIHVLSGISSEALSGLVAGAEVAIYPSLAEGFGLPPLEALALGVPSICAKVTAMADFDVLEDFFFDPSRAGSLERKLDSVLANPEKARAVAVEGALRVQEQFTWDASAEVLHQAISARLSERTRA